ncbi:MAG: DEAD/DEAH box helicase, partial [Catalinimonas sp.]
MINPFKKIKERLSPSDQPKDSDAESRRPAQEVSPTAADSAPVVQTDDAPPAAEDPTAEAPSEEIPTAVPSAEEETPAADVSFDDFPLSETLHESIAAMGYNDPTPVQKQAIPVLLAGRDMIACAQTGTGKTAAYLIPVINHIVSEPQEGTECLIVAPTRELVKQIDQQIDGFAYFTGVTSAAIYGGSTGGEVFSRQSGALKKGADIIVATPGRLLVLLKLNYANFENLKCLVLDEADKMLDMGFFEDILEIVSYLPKERQTLMFSATMPNKIRQLAAQILNNPGEVNIAVSKPAERIDQRGYLAYNHQKIDLLEHIVRQEEVSSMIVFTSRKSEVGRIVRALKKVKLDARGVSSDLEQAEREEVMRDFRNGKVRIIVATDVLSRGIDVDNISHVVNYDLPQDAEDYIHRIGRTARAERKGVAITFINEEKQFRVAKIERLMERELPKLPLPEGFEPGPDYNPDRHGG